MDNPFESTGVLVQRDDHPRPSFVAHRGSCFAFHDSEWFVTAKHCVSGVPPEELGVALYIEQEIASDIGWDVKVVHEHDTADLALLHLPNWGIEVFDPFIGVSEDVELGDPIRCFGYPTQAVPEGQPLVPRMLRGYVQRHFFHTSPLGTEYIAFEISNAAPAGLSGAPVSLDHDASRVIGVVAENFQSRTLLHQVSEVEEKGQVFREEVHSVVDFGIVVDLRQHRDWLADITGLDT